MKNRVSGMPTWAKVLAGTAGLAGISGLGYATFGD